MNTREIILEILMELEVQDSFTNVMLSNVLKKYDYLEPSEKAFIKRVTQGCIERKIQIDYVLNLFSSVKVHKMKKLIRALLRSSVYQILFMDAIPDSAVCNEAVKLAAKRKFTSLKGFVNGVLRKISREKDQIVYPDKETDYENYLHVVYSMPEYLVKHFLAHYGKTAAEETFQGFLETRPVSIRMKESLTETEVAALEKSWEEQGIKVLKDMDLPYARKLMKAEGIEKVPGFSEGAFTVQDVSSMLVCEAAAIVPGMTVIDVCAAPGGKSMHAAEKLEGQGHLYSFDVSEQKIEKIEENVRRLGYQNVTVEVQDARELKEELREMADVVLADVPCSGLGVIGKKQDIKYHVTEDGLASLLSLQKEILKNVCQYVKKGGILLYSTCTMNPMENEQMVEYICQELGFQKREIGSYLPERFAKDATDGMLQLFPGKHKTDGFFLARLEKQ